MPCLQHLLSREASAQRPGGDGEGGAEQEEPEEGAVEGAGGKEAAGTESAPDEGGVEMSAGEGAGEAIGTVEGADAGTGGEGPVEDGDLGDGAEEEAGELHEEEGAGGDLCRG